MVTMEVNVKNEIYDNIRAGNIGLSGEYIINTPELRVNVNMTGNNTYLSVIFSGIYLKPVRVHVFKNCESIELHPIDKNPCGSITIKPSFNGWTNCETWHTSLVLDNTESLYNFMRDAVKKYNVKVIQAMFTLWLTDPNQCPIKDIGLLVDELEGLDINKINWVEIVEDYLN